MKKLDLTDAINFAAVVEASGASDIIAAAIDDANAARLRRIAEDARLTAAFCIAEENKKDAAKEALERFRRDDSWVKNLGVKWAVKLFASVSKNDASALLFRFLARAFEKSEQDVAVMSLAAFKDNIRELLKENDAKDFFGSVSDLTSP